MPFAGYEQKVWVGPMGEEYRWARVLKTVVYIVVDEAADGTPVVDKWSVNQHRSYARLRARQCNELHNCTVPQAKTLKV